MQFDTNWLKEEPLSNIPKRLARETKKKKISEGHGENKMRKDFLHDHESFKLNIEKALIRSCDLFNLHEASSFYAKYAVVDKEDWEEAIRILMIKPMLTVPTEGYNTPPVEKLNSQLRPKQYIVPGNVTNEEVKNFHEGIKHDSDKPRYDLLPADALEEVAKVYAVGAKKYGDRNWELGLSYGRLFRALMSHSWAWWKGERDDKQNRLHHLTSVVFNALALLHYELNSEKYSKFDDRK